MKLRITLVLLLCLPCITLAADNQKLTDRTSTCSVVIPANWALTPGLGIAQSPDKKTSIAVTSPGHGLNSMAQVQQIAPTIYKDDKVTKSSGSEFEMEGKSQSGKPNVYRAVPAGARVCIAEITYDSGSPAEARSIVETLKPAK